MARQQVTTSLSSMYAAEGKEIAQQLNTSSVDKHFVSLRANASVEKTGCLHVTPTHHPETILYASNPNRADADLQGELEEVA